MLAAIYGRCCYFTASDPKQALEWLAPDFRKILLSGTCRFPAIGEIWDTRISKRPIHGTSKGFTTRSAAESAQHIWPVMLVVSEWVFRTMPRRLDLSLRSIHVSIHRLSSTSLILHPTRFAPFHTRFGAASATSWSYRLHDCRKFLPHGLQMCGKR